MLKSDVKRFDFSPMLGPAEDFQPGSVEWAERISNRLRLATEYVTHDTVHHIISCLKQIWASRPKPWEVWPEDNPFMTPDDYCLAVTGHSWSRLLDMVRELAGESFDRQMEIDLAKAQVEHRSQGTRTDLLPVVNRKLVSGSTNAPYLLRRLARDDKYKEILKTYERGGFKSVRAAALAAGILKELTPFEQIERLIKRLLPKLTDSERSQLKDLL